jgi:hypothetical protein
LKIFYFFGDLAAILHENFLIFPITLNEKTFRRPFLIQGTPMIVRDLSRNVRLYSSHWDTFSIKKQFQREDIVENSSIALPGAIKSDAEKTLVMEMWRFPSGEKIKKREYWILLHLAGDRMESSSKLMNTQEVSHENLDCQQSPIEAESTKLGQNRRL